MKQEKLMEKLNDRIEELQRGCSDNVINQSRLSEVLMIRAMICKMDKKEHDDLMDRVQTAAEKICDHYCKFPEAYYTGQEDDNERMIVEKCSACPLDELVR